MTAYGIPPHAHWQNEEFQRELKHVRAMLEALNWPEKVFTSPEEVAAWLRESGFRASRPVEAKTIRRWCRTRRFPWTFMRGAGVKFLTTNAHVLAWFFTLAKYKAPKRMKTPPAPLQVPL